MKFAVLRAIGRRLHVRGRDRLLRLLEGPSVRRDHAFVEDFFGFRYPGNLSRFIDWSVYFYGAYTGHELTLLSDLARGIRADGERQIVAWDIGANIGHHSLFLAGVADRVISFEPIPFNAELLEEKIAFNGVETIDLHRLALGEEAGQMPLHHPDMANSSNVGTASFHANYNPDNNIRQTEVRIVVGDQYRAERNLPAPDIIKIDVEGFERPALSGLAATIRESKPAILMETSPYTWKSFADQSDLETVLPDMDIYEIHARPDPMGYRAGPLRFGVSGEIFAIPRSRSLLREAFAQARERVIVRPEF